MRQTLIASDGVHATPYKNGTYNLIVIADKHGRLGVNRGGQFDEEGGIGYVNMALPFDPPIDVSFRIPESYMDTMALHEIFHAYMDQDSKEEHENGEPRTSWFRANPTIMAAGYTFKYGNTSSDEEPDVQCNGDDWETFRGLPNPSLVISECTHEQIEDYVGPSSRSGEQDFSHYR